MHLLSVGGRGLTRRLELSPVRVLELLEGRAGPDSIRCSLFPVPGRDDDRLLAVRREVGRNVGTLEDERGKVRFRERFLAPAAEALLVGVRGETELRAGDRRLRDGRRTDR